MPKKWVKSEAFLERGLEEHAGDGLLARIKELQSEKMEGSWEVAITPVVPPGVPPPSSFHAYGTFARGGAIYGSDRSRPFSKQHGTWEQTRGNEYAWTAMEDLFDATGVFAGTLIVLARVTIVGKDEFVGVSNGESRDAAGNVIFSRCGTIRGRRITVEPLAPQCEDITPPR